MKNAYVLVHHYGEDRDTPAGTVLRNITSTRFNELEKNGLVREATAEEVKYGSEIAFESEAEAAEKAAAEPENKMQPEPENKAVAGATSHRRKGA